MNKSLTRKIAFAIAGLSIIVGGLIYVLITDVYLLNTATWLFFAILASFGSGIGFILSDNIKKKLVWRYIVRALCIILSLVFVFILFKYNAQFDSNSSSYDNSLVQSIRSLKNFKIAQVISLSNTICIISAVFGFLSTIAQITSVAFDAIFKVDD